MELLETRLPDVKLIQPHVLTDERGFFCETYRRSAFHDLGIDEEMIQGNHSRSRRGVVRGLHFQIGRGASKLVRCGRGRILDVVVDLRRGSPTYTEWEAFELDDESLRTVYVPVGFAHGFCVLSDVADVIYMQDRYYSPLTERGVRYDDPEIGVQWPQGLELLPSERDATAPSLGEVRDELPFVYLA